MEEKERRMAAGIALIVIGTVLYLLERSRGIDAAAVFLLMGSAFFAAYLYRREYGYLVPAGILLGLGTGTILGQTRYAFGDTTLFGLGLGFIAIYVVSLLYERKNRWWPLIPGGVLILLNVPRVGDTVDFFFDNWPLILIIVGVLILLGAFRPRRPKSA
jgi:Na+/H+ antiporter NhaD/arsenite permease-like protein